MTISPRRFGFAVGVVAATFYLGCVIMISLAGPQACVYWFNSVFHGLDASPIINRHLNFLSTVYGLINTFILAWIFGGLLAVVYNLSLPKAKKV